MTSDPGPGAAERTVVVGLGNVLCGDDGLGVAAAFDLGRRYRVPAAVQILDGGTLGLALMSELFAAPAAILLDAVAADAPPGTLVRLVGDDVTSAVRARLSVHQVGVADLLDGLRLAGGEPRRLVLLGVVPERVTLGLERSAAVAAAMPALVTVAAAELRALGHRLESKNGGTDRESRGDVSRGDASLVLDAARGPARVGLL